MQFVLAPTFVKLKVAGKVVHQWLQSAVEQIGREQPKRNGKLVLNTVCHAMCLLRINTILLIPRIKRMQCMSYGFFQEHYREYNLGASKLRHVSLDTDEFSMGNLVILASSEAMTHGYTRTMCVLESEANVLEYKKPIGLVVKVSSVRII